MRMTIPAAAALIAMTAAGLAFAADGEVNVYTYREPALIEPIFAEFTKESGIRVNVIFAKDGLEQKILAESQNSPADMLLTTDIARLQEAADIGIAQPVASDILKQAIPEQLRDPGGNWFALTMRARVVYASKERVKDTAITYEDLADPKWKGKICIRSGQHIYNNALFAAYLGKHGEAETETWITGIKNNLAQKPSGGDRDVAKDIAAGVCDIGLGNTYYVGLMTNGNDEQKGWAGAINVILPTFKDGGTHVNVSGAVIAKHAPNKDNAVKLLEWLAGDKAQQLYATANYEYPVRAGIETAPVVAGFGELKPDVMPMAEIAKNKKKAAEIVDKVAFDEGPGT
ncbi:MAG: Fe(3+) ABC transporter substrate-binding protein [Aestuariivirga sp.]